MATLLPPKILLVDEIELDLGPDVLICVTDTFVEWHRYDEIGFDRCVDRILRKWNYWVRLVRLLEKSCLLKTFITIFTNKINLRVFPLFLSNE